MTPAEWRRRVEALEDAAPSGVGEIVVEIHGDPEWRKLHPGPDLDPPKAHPTAEEYAAYAERSRRAALQAGVTRLVIRATP